MKGILIGADPEFFLRNKETGLPASAVGLIGGSKFEPRRISDQGEAIQEDGVACEFNCKPSKDWQELNTSIEYCLDYVKSIIPRELEVLETASEEFPAFELTSHAAQEIGCTPDFEAWTGKKNRISSYNNNWRAVGGHLHLSYPNPTKTTSVEIIKAMDLFLGVPSVILDKDTQRKILYGKAGAYRMKEWGVEYRTLSNFWIFNKQLVKWAYENSIKSVEFVLAGKKVSNFLTTNQEEIIACINNSDKSLARTLVDKYKLDILQEQYVEI